MMPTTDIPPIPADGPGRLTVIGESLVDIIFNPYSGGSGSVSHPGGSPLNVAVGCSRLGVPTTLVTHYAEDPYGTMIEDHLASNGVSVINGGSAPTSIATATLNEAGAAEYSFDIRWDISGASLPALAAVESSRHVHTGSIATVLPAGCHAVYALIEAARANATVSYDPNCRPAISPDIDAARHRIEQFVALSDLVKASDEDLAWLYPGRAPHQSAKAWLETGPTIVVVTRGAQGPMVLTAGATVMMPALGIDVADTVGAGDSFMAALISWLDIMGLLGADARKRWASLSEEELRSLAAYANRAAAITCSRPGADPPWANEVSNDAFTNVSLKG